VADQDQELLELAAKAAGIKLLWTCGGIPVNTPTLFEGLGSDTVWNPLTDDGDSARLRSALMMNVNWYDDGVEVDLEFSCGHFLKIADHSNDRDAALRMATLKCAVEYARRMG
jgi:hypothetical protein